MYVTNTLSINRVKDLLAIQYIVIGGTYNRTLQREVWISGPYPHVVWILDMTNIKGTIEEDLKDDSCNIDRSHI